MWFGKLDISILENWLWEACSIRSPIDAPKYKDYMVSLISRKRFWRNIEKNFYRKVEQVEIL